MAKKNILSNNPLFNTQEEPQEVAEPKKMGRPRNKDLVRDNSVQEGLTEDLTRATFILRVDTLNALKDYAYTERLTLKDALDGIITKALEEYKADPNNQLLSHKK